jgi:hypothetical protein
MLQTTQSRQKFHLGVVLAVISHVVVVSLTTTKLTEDFTALALTRSDVTHRIPSKQSVISWIHQPTSVILPVLCLSEERLIAPENQANLL